MPENLNAQPLAIFGAEDMIQGFKALGFHAFPVRDAAEFKAVLPGAIAAGAVVCLVEEALYREAPQEIARYQDLPLPILLPFSRDSRAELLADLVKRIRLKATGAD